MDKETFEEADDLLTAVRRRLRPPRCPICGHRMARSGPRDQETGELLWYCQSPKAKGLNYGRRSKRKKQALQHYWDSRTSRPAPDRELIIKLCDLTEVLLDCIEESSNEEAKEA